MQRKREEIIWDLLQREGSFKEMNFRTAFKLKQIMPLALAHWPQRRDEKTTTRSEFLLLYSA